MDTDDLPIKDTLVVKISDLHSGGTTSLFPNIFWQFKTETNHTPTDTQLELFAHFEKCARLISVLRKGKRLIVVHNGDAIDGVHHGTLQIVTRQKNEQIDIHVWLMKHFLKLCKFKKGDKIYYTVGTEVHTDDNEDLIGEKMGAEKDSDKYAFNELHLDVNGKEFWFAHKGPSAGKGANQGNALYNFMRDLWLDCKTNNIRPPDDITFSHVHTPRYRTYDRLVENKIISMTGSILPSFQLKNRYAHGVAAMQSNKIGIAYCEVTKSGDIINPNFEIM